MSVINQQLQSYREQVRVLNSIHGPMFHQKLMQMFEGTKVEMVTMRSISHPTLPGRSANVYQVAAETVEVGSYVGSTFTYAQKPDGSYDITEDGNEGMRDFLACDIEFSVWCDIMEELSDQSREIHAIYNLGTDENQVVWTRDSCWVACVVDDPNDK